jgi:hypothetical protein
MIYNVPAAGADCQCGAVRFLRRRWETPDGAKAMSADKGDRAETDAMNKGLDREEERLRDPERRPPRRAVDSDASEPERPTTPQEDAEQDIAHLENPPQSEGPRERNNDAV